jgi:hypothetical protein
VLCPTHHVVVEGLVVEEELGEVAQVLAVVLLLRAVHLEHGQPVVAVDLIAWPKKDITDPLMTCKTMEKHPQPRCREEA